jgi:hypothetical protein
MVNDHLAYRFRLGVTNDVLAEILWRGTNWPKHWGMYVLLDRDHDIPVIPNSVRVRLASMGSEILGGFLEIGGFEFLISFEWPPVRRIYRPAALTFQRVGFRNCYKMAAFAWPESGHEMVNVWSQVPPNQSVTVPPAPRRLAMPSRSFLVPSTSPAEPNPLMGIKSRGWGWFDLMPIPRRHSGAQAEKCCLRGYPTLSLRSSDATRSQGWPFASLNVTTKRWASDGFTCVASESAGRNISCDRACAAIPASSYSS